ncbi:hypothetical protein [Tenacibaculum aestuariivivum]|uniref:hypothetical protein n=1 Tax=Tenacibaculum aestuariivivum TaxID=2006131 RepID=UPI003AB36489
MKKIYLLLFLITTVTAFSQDNKDSNFWDNVRFGGGFGLDFGNNNTTVSISPSAIYNFNKSFSLGLGVGYLYNKRADFKSNVFSSSIISLYNPLKEIQISAEYEHLFVNRSSNTINNTYNYPALYLGAAYRSGNFSLGIRYDVLYNKDKSIYTSPISPIVRIYF